MLCSILSCRASKCPTYPNLTLHRLPKDEARKRRWIESVGEENIADLSIIFICGRHFEEKDFIKFHNLLRLHSDAVPSLRLNSINSMEPQKVNPTCPSTSSPLHLPGGAIITSSDQIPQVSNHSTTSESVGEQHNVEETKKMQCLRNTCEKQTMNIKALTEQVRRGKRTIVRLKRVVQCLKLENTQMKEKGINYKEYCMPDEYSEETRRFAITLYLISPEAYEVVRQTYNKCLPHPNFLELCLK